MNDHRQDQRRLWLADVKRRYREVRKRSDLQRVVAHHAKSGDSYWATVNSLVTDARLLADELARDEGALDVSPVYQRIWGSTMDSQFVPPVQTREVEG